MWAVIAHAYDIPFIWALLYGKRSRSFMNKTPESIMNGCSDEYVHQ